MLYRLELDRGYGFEVRNEGAVPAATSLDAIKADAMRGALNGPVRAFLDGALVFEHAKLTRKQAKTLFGI
jgi:hypothetical protein